MVDLSSRLDSEEKHSKEKLRTELEIELEMQPTTTSATNLHRLHSESHNSAHRDLDLHTHKALNKAEPILKHRNVRQPWLHVVLIVAHCLGLACSMFVFAWVLCFRGGLPFISHDLVVSDPHDLIFNMHPVLMVVGFIVLASEGILVFRGVHGTQNFKKGIHLTVQGCALFMAIIGIWAAFRFHNLKAIDNLYSLHSWLGIITVVLFGSQWICGFVTYWYPGARGKLRASLLPWHVFMGLLIYFLALLSSETGFLEKMTFLMVNKKISRYGLEAMFVNCTALLLIVYGLIVILAPVLPKLIKDNSERNQD